MWRSIQRSFLSRTGLRAKVEEVRGGRGSVGADARYGYIMFNPDGLGMREIAQWDVPG
jgi:hypothetical protein